VHTFQTIKSGELKDATINLGEITIKQAMTLIQQHIEHTNLALELDNV
jgi:hypothetical protein